MDPLEARELFPVTRDRIYLQHAGLSPLSLRTREAVERVARLTSEGMDWSEEYHRDWEDLRASLAALVGMDPGEVTLTRGTGHALSFLARGLDWRDGDNIVSVRGEFPTNVFPWTLLERRGVQLRLADPVDGRIDPDALLALADARTRAVAISWVWFWNGYRCDVAAIGSRCRERGILFAVDAIQGVGALRIDARDACIDLLACGGSKWLIGPPGTGFCAIRSDLLDTIAPPLLGGGNLVIEPGTPLEDLRTLKPDAHRYEESAVSWFDIAALLAGVRLIEEVGPDVIEARVLTLARTLGEGLERLGYRMVEPWPRDASESSGIVSVRPSTPAPDAVRILWDAGISARLYRDSVRFSTHFYNTEQEVETVLDATRSKVGAQGYPGR